MSSTPATPRRARRALLLAGALALASASLLGSLHVACAHGSACDVPERPVSSQEHDDPSGHHCAVCRLIQGTPPAVTATWTPPAPEPAGPVLAEPSADGGVTPRPIPCVRAPPVTATV